jgi:hypothetical protein
VELVHCPCSCQGVDISAVRLTERLSSRVGLMFIFGYILNGFLLESGELTTAHGSLCVGIFSVGQRQLKLSITWSYRSSKIHTGRVEKGFRHSNENRANERRDVVFS